MGLIWPFRNRIDGPNPGVSGSGQWRRVDEGVDLQTNVGAEVLAILPGTVHYAHDPGTNGAHFGASYPVVYLDTPYNGHIAVYYGHTYPAVREGSHVNQGDVVSHTGNPGNGGAPAGWLEIGWWRNGPEGSGGNWTQAGQDMHDHLINAPTHQGDDLLSALSDAEQRELLENTRYIRAVIANDDGAIRDIQSRVGNVVEPDVEAIKKHDQA